MMQNADFIPASDITLYKYFGTWQATDDAAPHAMVSHWTLAYVELDFTGDSVTVAFSRECSFKYRIDNGEYISAQAAGGDFTVDGCKDGRHTLRLLSQGRKNHIYFAGAYQTDVCRLSRPASKPHYVQFIGDSISETPLSFSHRSAELLGWDYSVIACSALSLVRNRGYWRTASGWYWEGGKNCWIPGSMADRLYKNFGCLSIGMEDAFFKLGVPTFGTGKIEDCPEFENFAQNYFTPKFDHDFATGNYPDIVFIFLGTNDLTVDDPESACDAFIRSYREFVDKLLSLYGKDTQICIMQALTGGKGTPISTQSARVSAIIRAAEAIREDHPHNLHYVDHETVASWNAEISEDTTHPSPAGYDTLTRAVAAYLGGEFR